MNNSNKNKTNVTSGHILNRLSLRFVKQDLSEILRNIDSVWMKIEDNELKLMLSIAKDEVEEVYDEIRDREEKVEGLIKSISS
ncbi:MAG: hypothetical protein ACR2IS_07130 [Nitrososphaeraceae archaeon]